MYFQVWNSIFEVCEETGKALYQEGVITNEDLKDWKRSDSRILNIGLPAYVLLQCFLRSIKSDSPGNGKVLTQTNRPEGRAFDFFFEPMSIMLEQLKRLKLQESEELYLSKLVLTAGDSERMEKWHNGGIPPADEIKKGQLQGISKSIYSDEMVTTVQIPTIAEAIKSKILSSDQPGRMTLGIIYPAWIGICTPSITKVLVDATYFYIVFKLTIFGCRLMPPTIRCQPQASKTAWHPMTSVWPLLGNFSVAKIVNQESP
ncbi:hypothetical protein KI387_011942, partial [Taxus chinensis]